MSDSQGMNVWYSIPLIAILGYSCCLFQQVSQLASHLDVATVYLIVTHRNLCCPTHLHNGRKRPQLGGEFDGTEIGNFVITCQDLAWHCEQWVQLVFQQSTRAEPRQLLAFMAQCMEQPLRLPFIVCTPSDPLSACCASGARPDVIRQASATCAHVAFWTEREVRVTLFHSSISKKQVKRPGGTWFGRESRVLNSRSRVWKDGLSVKSSLMWQMLRTQWCHWRR